MDAVPTPEGVWGQGRPCRSRPLTALPPVDPVDRQEAADGQSADRSRLIAQTISRDRPLKLHPSASTPLIAPGSLQPSLRFRKADPARPACGGRPRSATTRQRPGSQSHGIGRAAGLIVPTNRQDVVARPPGPAEYRCLALRPIGTRKALPSDRSGRADMPSIRGRSDEHGQILRKLPDLNRQQLVQ